MIEIKIVTKRSDLKRFIEFPNNLYRNNEFYVPYLTVDELSNLNLKIEKNNADNYALKCFLAHFILDFSSRPVSIAILSIVFFEENILGEFILGIFFISSMDFLINSLLSNSK